FVLFYISLSYFGFIIAMALYSLGDAFRTGTHKAMIFDYLKIKNRENQKVYYYGHTRSYSQLGSAISALIAGFIVFFTGSFRLIFLFSTIPYILDLILIASYPNELDGSIARFRKGKISANFKKVFFAFLYSFKEMKVLKAIANLSLFTGYYKAVKDYLQPVLKTLALALPVFVLYEEKQRASVIIGTTYFIIYLITSYSSRNSGRFAEKFKSLNLPLNFTILAGLIFGSLSGLFFEMELMLLSIAFFIGIFVIENLRKPIGISYVAENINKDILATALSAESQAHTLIAALIAPAIGIVADFLGIGYAIMLASLFLVFISPFFLLKKK
ncbi:MAG: hypothetical protein K8R68_03425, partial [Bacteroidales bacterium]|nr:hypothetical protein [Bacteroidales bacterium]